MKSSYQGIIEELKPWFHNIHLPDGSQTCPDHFLGDFPKFKWNDLETIIPRDLSGYKILDVGCNAGFYGIELAKRGAEVTGIDVDAHYLEQAQWITEVFELEHKITLEQKQVYDLANDPRQFDLVWFMGVFYHLRYPLLALDILSQHCKDVLLLQTLMLPGKEEEKNTGNREINDREDLLKAGWPKMAFVEQKFSGDPTNWWVPNHAGIKAMLRTCGFSVEKEPLDETYWCRKDLQHKPVINDWNRSEYLSAIQKPWLETVEDKTEK